MGRPHSGVPRGSRGSAEGQAVHDGGTNRACCGDFRSLEHYASLAEPAPAASAVVHHPRGGLAMHDLEQIQRWMQTVIMHLNGVESGVASAEARRLIDVAPTEVEQVVTRSRALAALDRLEIYNRAYF